jgi:hypothetical protein
MRIGSTCFQDDYPIRPGERGGSARIASAEHPRFYPRRPPLRLAQRQLLSRGAATLAGERRSRADVKEKLRKDEKLGGEAVTVFAGPAGGQVTVDHERFLPRWVVPELRLSIRYRYEKTDR